MANAWFRLYSEFSDDPKVQMMPEEMQRRLVMLFCSKCKGETLHETELAFHWRISNVSLSETKALFIEKGFIDEHWNLLNWNKRQFLSDSSTERVRRHRQAVKQDETLHETELPVTVTPPEQNRTDTDTDKTSTKPSRKRVKKEPTMTDLAKSRHAEFKAAIETYWKSKNQIQMPWDAKEGKQLEMWLRSAPAVTIEQFTAMLRNRFKSGVNHGERPSAWINRVTVYANGPVDNFGKPIGSSNGQSNAITRVENNQRRWANASAALGFSAGRDAGTNGSELPKSGIFGKYDADMAAIVPRPEPEVRIPEPTSRTEAVFNQTGAEVLSPSR